MVPVVDAITHTVTIANTIANGTVTTDKATAAKDEKVTLTVTPATGYELDTLTVKEKTSGAAVTVAADNTFTMPDDDVTVTATFVKAEVPLTGITLDKTTANIVVGATTTLTATKAPADTTDDTAITWTTSDATVATVAGGVVTGVKAGTATITATCGEKTATCAVTVKTDATPCTAVTLNKETAEVKKGETVTLTATVTPTDTTDELTWTTSDATVATVANGVITGVGRGTATITAKCGDKTATCAVSVTEDKVKTEALVAVGGSTSYDTLSSDGKLKTIDVVYAISEADLASKGYTVTITNEKNKKSITKDITTAYTKVTVPSTEKLGNDTYTGYYLVVRVINVPADVTLAYLFAPIA
ncbi:MAG: Ig-like domain-containing protein [Bacteroides sp.]|nr:Ig-like domain-containing protein [Bacteroides sp.]